MECPLRLIAGASLSQERINQGGWVSEQCQGGGCALWNNSLGVCGLVAQAYLAGLEVERKERGGNKD